MTSEEKDLIKDHIRKIRSAYRAMREGITTEEERAIGSQMSFYVEAGVIQTRDIDVILKETL
jgi:hypothetical protein